MEYYEFAYGMTMLITSLISWGLVVLLIVALWKLFTKAGEPGWAAIIPFYNSYVLCKIAGKVKLFWGILACTIAMVVAYIALIFSVIFGIGVTVIGAFSSYNSGYSSTSGTPFIVIAVISGIVFVACSIAALVFRILVNIGLAKNFGQSGAFAVGLILLPYIFYPIMAFSKSMQYIYAQPYNPYGQPYNPYGQNNMYGTSAQPYNPYGQNNMYGTPAQPYNPYGQQNQAQPAQPYNPYGQQDNANQQFNPYSQQNGQDQQ